MSGRALNIGVLGELECAGAGAWKPPSAVIHDDNRIIRHTNHIFIATGVEIRHLDCAVKRERQWRVTGGVTAQSCQIVVNDFTALAQKSLGILHQSRVFVRNSVTSFCLVEADLIYAGPAVGTKPWLSLELVRRLLSLVHRFGVQDPAWPDSHSIALDIFPTLNQSKTHVKANDGFVLEVFVSTQYCHLAQFFGCSKPVIAPGCGCIGSSADCGRYVVPSSACTSLPEWTLLL